MDDKKIEARTWRFLTKVISMTSNTDGDNEMSHLTEQPHSFVHKEFKVKVFHIWQLHIWDYFR